ncbi:C45 family autoproteolytic acyltransferase/hydolase [Streptomyces pinistramenti]|uniref:C45 family autoproteolytic acyltransferase/hydolase n=1 Tax=Streptomyces pinistramenti TaxID=2884812 RepID=UPI001D0687CE|nr:C45 family autoproteolytic acyltransferase/hydolase [Streptomyces pinistramenti]MCB5906217.1 C45 family autoproteolytic acyltransferase/hydrolase [Streptomyces pinistramenti]
MHADVLVRVAHVETLDDAHDPAQPASQVVAVRDGRILAVGGEEVAASFRGPATAVHDFPGGVLLPGLTDAHAHPVWGSSETGSGIDLSGADSLEAVLATVADALRERPDDAWVTGYGLDLNHFPGTPGGAVLGERFPGRAISLMTRDAHALVVSPRVVELAGLTGRETFGDTSSVEVGADGRPTGHVVELQAMDLVFAHYPEVPVGTAAGYVLALVLEEAGSVAEAVEIVRSAPIASSGSFTVFDATDAVLLDLSPDGVFALEPDNGTLVRTNHFLTPTPAANEKTWLYQPDSGNRYALIQQRLTDTAPPRSADELVALLVSGEGEAALTCLPDMSLPEGQRWASLATVILEPAARTARILDGTPADAVTRPWRFLHAQDNGGDRTTT